MIGAAGLLWNLWKTRNVDCFQRKLPKDSTDVVFPLCWLEILHKEKVQKVVQGF
jgi:hypothetical protein